MSPSGSTAHFASWTVISSPMNEAANPGIEMRGYTTKEKLKITAGAVSALVIVAWIAVLAIIFLSVR
jgi:hypothetical protein